MKSKKFILIAFSLAVLIVAFVVVRTALIEHRYASIVKDYSFEEMIYIVCEDQSISQSHVHVEDHKGTLAWQNISCQGTPLEIQSGMGNSIHFQSFRSLLVARNVSVFYGEDGRPIEIEFEFRPFF